MITLKQLNAVFYHIDADRDILIQLDRELSYYFPGYRFSQKYKSGMWDGKIHLFNLNSNLIPVGFKFFLEQRFKDQIIEIENNDLIKPHPLSKEEIKDIYHKIPLKDEFKPRDYQKIGFYYSLRDQRKVLVSATGSGKSLMIYLIVRGLLLSNQIKKALIIVPKINLVDQMFSDFLDYAPDPNFRFSLHKIKGKGTRNDLSSINISTWQSIYRENSTWFHQFDFVLGDECHLFKARSLRGIMSKLINSHYRIATTGTLENTEINKLEISAMFGDIIRLSKASDLIEKGVLSNLNVDVKILKFGDDVKRVPRRYHDEVEFILGNEQRMNRIVSDVLSLDGNTIVMFRFIEHGKRLFERLKEKNGSDKTFFIDGSVTSKRRNQIREIFEKSDGNILVASVGTVAEGMNIKRLHNAVLASPLKSYVKVIQSIGRILRTHDEKSVARWIDYVDDLRFNGRMNYALKHGLERIEMYKEENYPYSVEKVNV